MGIETKYRKSITHLVDEKFKDDFRDLLDGKEFEPWKKFGVDYVKKYLLLGNIPCESIPFFSFGIQRENRVLFLLFEGSSCTYQIEIDLQEARVISAYYNSQCRILQGYLQENGLVANVCTAMCSMGVWSF